MPKRPTKTFSDAGLIKPATPSILPNPLLDPIGFEQLIRNRGLRWKHEKGAICPAVKDLETLEHDPNCRKCENGYLFFNPVEVMGTFESNKLEKMYEIQGTWTVGEAITTFASYLDGPNGEPGLGAMVDFQQGDKLTCLDYSFTWQELVEYSLLGTDRLRYPALHVDFLADTERTYALNTDFEITPEGNIKWVSGNRPKYLADRSKGSVYTVVYSARPIFYVVQIMHEIRATKGYNRKTNKVEAVRLPQQLLIRRDFLFNRKEDAVGKGTGAP